MSERFSIPSYCDYINKYVLQASTRGKANIPGEHHFVGVYLLGRLQRFEFLGVPHYVNPDGMKASTGDVVYCSYLPHASICYVPTVRLKIEVKLGKGTICLTRMQYYHCIRQEWRPQDKKAMDCVERPQQPDLFIGVSGLGVMIMPWTRFREVFIREVYPSGLVDMPEGKRNTRCLRMSRFPWNGDSERTYFRYSKSMDDWPTLEAAFVETLREQCAAIVGSEPLRPLQDRLER